jgi:DNA end-binding protein Ku
VLKAQRDMLLLLKIRYAEEIRDYSDLNIPKDLEVRAPEMKMAESLIAQLTPKKFSMDKYKDTYDEELMKIIEAHAKGKKLVTPKIKIVPSKSTDLMEQLKASLGEGTRKKAS